MWQLIIYDDKYLFYHCRISEIHTLLALEYGNNKNKIKTLEHLDSAKNHSILYDSIPEGVHYYTSIFVSSGMHDKNKTSKNYAETDLEMFVRTLKSQAFDFIRNDSDFITFEQSIKNGL